ncbi:hypothetical protein QQ045_020788 [Rhodiola kirilowii]
MERGACFERRECRSGLDGAFGKKTWTRLDATPLEYANVINEDRMTGARDVSAPLILWDQFLSHGLEK